MASRSFEEEAFGKGRVAVWDEGDIEVRAVSPGLITLTLTGHRISGGYELRRMPWYPGNHWLLAKIGMVGDPQKNPCSGS